ncbi:lytic transglycosylase domain-containing protein [Alsobacter sp. SYSU M60028]|uniref:Lytic transglycosylase domain-containing protein n=1 Tax=Alsobacter ponti TaxID=2962936 RepID=A0ABT1LGZ4_9HYPH|nr:lytic transglycosylase domain-containing protein [Alsobacter ponti]MCP8940361.1 lytic transglycosylase domain-containing protein [Alsobacter ponti]
MFLFTTPPSAPETRSQSPVLDAIRGGSERTGADFDYLMKTAQRESSLDPQARASTSSASGLFQFVEQTWLGLVKGTGAQHGLSGFAGAIAETRSGRYEVSDPATRAQILALRGDPAVASVMAGELTRRNEASLAAALGRAPTQGELYIAHVLGASGGADLIRRAAANPGASAAAAFPEAAQANRAIFFDKSGRPRGVGEVHSLLAGGVERLAVPAVAQLKSDPSTWLGATQAPLATAYVEQDGPAIHSLFRTEGRRGPLNETVRRLWGGAPAAAVAADPVRFFPRTASSAVVPAESPEDGARPASVPLPPERPRDLGRTHPGRSLGASRGPLDLTTFLQPKV